MTAKKNGAVQSPSSPPEQFKPILGDAELAKRSNEKDGYKKRFDECLGEMDQGAGRIVSAAMALGEIFEYIKKNCRHGEFAAIVNMYGFLEVRVWRYRNFYRQHKHLKPTEWPSTMSKWEAADKKSRKKFNNKNDKGELTGDYDGENKGKPPKSAAEKTAEKIEIGLMELRDSKPKTDGTPTADGKIVKKNVLPAPFNAPQGTLIFYTKKVTEQPDENHVKVTTIYVEERLVIKPGSQLLNLKSKTPLQPTPTPTGGGPTSNPNNN